MDLYYRWLLLEVRLIAFFLAVSAEETVGPGGEGRHLHREAVADVLPDQWRRDGPADEPDDLRHGELNPALRRLWIRNAPTT